MSGRPNDRTVGRWAPLEDSCGARGDRIRSYRRNRRYRLNDWMKRLFLAIGASAVLVATMAPGAALARSPFPTERQVIPDRLDSSFKPAALARNERIDVFVKLAGDPVAVAQGIALDRAGGTKLSDAARARIRAGIAARQDALKGRIKAAGGTVVGQYQDAINAMRVTIPRKKVAALSRLPGVVKVQQVRVHVRGNVNTDTFIGADKAWTANQGYAGYTGYTGAGQRIAILDTGVDYYHANFGGSGDPQHFACDTGTNRTGDDDPSCKIARGGAQTFPTTKVVEGWDFMGDCYNASEDPDDPSLPTLDCPAGFSDVPAPDSDPLDCNGHGSHVAGTAAGFGVVGGKTPQRYVGAYNSTTLAANEFVIEARRGAARQDPRVPRVRVRGLLERHRRGHRPRRPGRRRRHQHVPRRGLRSVG